VLSPRSWNAGGEKGRESTRRTCENDAVTKDAPAPSAVEGYTVDADRLAEICHRYRLTELAVFGSAARGDLQPDSDIDLLYVPGPDAHLGWRIEELAEELAALFGRPVDLVSKRHLHELLREQILHDARTLYAA
jgi:predicted nucleotidyltransferase